MKKVLAIPIPINELQKYAILSPILSAGVGKKGPGKKGPGKKGPVKTVPVKTVLGKNGPGKKGSDYGYFRIIDKYVPRFHVTSD